MFRLLPAQRLSYSSWRRHQTPVSLRPLGARSTPGFEVKFFLDPGKTLDASNVPTLDVLTAFQAAGPLSINMQFLDGPGLELHKAGWNVRFIR
jgi:hypothetical protein